MPGRESQRRRLIRHLYLNGALWGLGNGLVSSSLVVYLANSYGVERGFWTSLIIAAPRLVGVLRLGTPLWIERVGNPQKFCVRSFLSANAVLLLLPICSLGNAGTGESWLTMLVAMWTVYHLLDYFGIVSLWAWIGQAVPGPIRGRFIGRRLAILNACQVVSMILSGWGNIEWRSYCNTSGQPENFWYGYVFCVCAGAVLMACAVWPLARAPRIVASGNLGEPSSTGLREICAPFADRAYWRFLVYGAWFSLSNGIAGTAMFLYRIRVLDISYGAHLTMDGASQGVQSLVMPWCGKKLDRWGGVPVLTIAQVLVALSMVFFLIASPDAKWWIVGAYVMWIAYAGINTAMPKLMLAFSPPGQYAAYSAAWFAWLEFVYALATLAGGKLFDTMSKDFEPINLGDWEIDHFAALFLLGLVLRLTAAIWASLIREP